VLSPDGQLNSQSACTLENHALSVLRKPPPTRWLVAGPAAGFVLGSFQKIMLILNDIPASFLKKSKKRTRNRFKATKLLFSGHIPV
jgi:hypothetical protein